MKEGTFIFFHSLSSVDILFSCEEPLSGYQEAAVCDGYSAADNTLLACCRHYCTALLVHCSNRHPEAQLSESC